MISNGRRETGHIGTGRVRKSGERGGTDHGGRRRTVRSVGHGGKGGAGEEWRDRIGQQRGKQGVARRAVSGAGRIMTERGGRDGHGRVGFCWKRRGDAGDLGGTRRGGTSGGRGGPRPRDEAIWNITGG